MVTDKPQEFLGRSLCRTPQGYTFGVSSEYVTKLCKDFGFGELKGSNTLSFEIPDDNDTILDESVREVGVVKRVHTLFGGVHKLAMALKEVEEVQEEVQEIKKMNGKDEEVKENGGLKVEGAPHTSCIDEMTCATPLSHAVQCES